MSTKKERKMKPTYEQEIDVLLEILAILKVIEYNTRSLVVP